MSQTPIPLGDTVSLVVDQPSGGVVVVQAPQAGAYVPQADPSALSLTAAAPATIVAQLEGSAQAVQSPATNIVVEQAPQASAIVSPSAATMFGAPSTPTAFVFSSSGGPRGPAGDTAEVAVTVTAGQNLSAGRLVVITAGEAFYFDPTNVAHYGRAFGVTVSSALIGQVATVKQNGTVQDAAFSFSADAPVYVGPDGELSTTPPAYGMIQLVGTAVAADTLFINILSSILRV